MNVNIDIRMVMRIIGGLRQTRVLVILSLQQFYFPVKLHYTNSCYLFSIQYENIPSFIGGQHTMKQLKSILHNQKKVELLQVMAMVTKGQ